MFGVYLGFKVLGFRVLGSLNLGFAVYGLRFRACLRSKVSPSIQRTNSFSL